jgi:hypothetical protein
MLKITLQILFIAIAFNCLFLSDADSFELNGRISSDLYAYRGVEDDHLRPYLRFYGDMLAWRTMTGRSLRLHTSLRWTSDLSDKLPSDPELFVYSAYAHLAKFLPQTDMLIGRQFVYTGVGSALMDGGSIHFRRYQNLSLNLFGGSTVSSEDPEQIQSPGDHLVVGGRFTARPDKATRMGLSWMLRRRDGDESFHRIGFDAGRFIGPGEIYGRTSYNAIDHRLAEILARATYRPGKWYFSGEYYWREPFVASNSIFTLIDFERYQIGRLEARRRVWKSLSLVTHIQTDFTGDDDIWRAAFGFSTPRLSLLWIHQTGYGGDNDGISGHANVALSERWSCYASANLYRYRVQLEQLKRSDAYASTVGVRWRANWGITIQAEGQYLRNAVFKDDGRFLLRIIKEFSLRSNKNGETT